MKTDKQKTGSWGENQAALFLEQNGFEILERNFRVGKAEVDIVAIKESLLVFVEVKVRRDASFGYPETFAGQKQQARIKLAAEKYQIDNQFHGFIRFDIISILGIPKSFEIEHFKDAF